MTWKNFDEILENYYGLIYEAPLYKVHTRDLSKYNLIKYAILNGVAGSATFLPLDFTGLLHHLLGIKEKRQNDFNHAYDTYRREIYENYVGANKPNQKIYAYDNTDKPENKLPLFPPASLLKKIKEDFIAKEKAKEKKQKTTVIEI